MTRRRMKATATRNPPTANGPPTRMRSGMAGSSEMFISPALRPTATARWSAPCPRCWGCAGGSYRLHEDEGGIGRSGLEGKGARAAVTDGPQLLGVVASRGRDDRDDLDRLALVGRARAHLRAVELCRALEDAEAHRVAR